ncbi:PAAR domain-containing protein [uncultured Roseovarius sp.]|uniref:PAAR domain-containing protein n=1 Tax=uncultured Roseovarius sp. TaxID=293344 RepID=UPI0026082D48|nr:PAAR domain-containing protein [uncultured Roseovarius sp.]
MPPAARLTDMHTCPMVTPGLPPVPHVGGPIVGPGVPNVLIEKFPASVLGDMATCVGPPDSIIKGSATVMISRRPAARIGDTTAHGGVIVAGAPTVIVGG